MAEGEPDTIRWPLWVETTVKALGVLAALLLVIDTGVGVNVASKAGRLHDIDLRLRRQGEALNAVDLHLRDQMGRLNAIDLRLRGQQEVLNGIAESRARVDLEDKLARALVVSCSLATDVAAGAQASALLSLTITNRSARPLRVSRLSLYGWLGEARGPSGDAGILWMNGPHEERGTGTVRWRSVLAQQFDPAIGHNMGVLELNERSRGDYPLRLTAPPGTWVMLKFEFYATPVDREVDGGVELPRHCEIICRSGRGASGCVSQRAGSEEGV